jgi:hypothetical protein
MIDDATRAAMPPVMRDIYDYYRKPGSEYVNWEFDWDGKTISFVVPAGGGMCDFCGPTGGGPYTVWPADDVIMLTGAELGDGVPHESLSSWHACLDCTPLVAAANHEALFQRALRIMRAERPANDHPRVVAAMRQAHRAFWKAKK